MLLGWRQAERATAPAATLPPPRAQPQLALGPRSGARSPSPSQSQPNLDITPCLDRPLIMPGAAACRSGQQASVLCRFKTQHPGHLIQAWRIWRPLQAAPAQPAAAHPAAAAAAARVHVAAAADVSAAPAEPGASPCSYELREYQQEAIEKIQEAAGNRGIKRQLVSLPTGALQWGIKKGHQARRAMCKSCVPWTTGGLQPCVTSQHESTPLCCRLRKDGHLLPPGARAGQPHARPGAPRRAAAADGGADVCGVAWRGGRPREPAEEAV